MLPQTMQQQLPIMKGSCCFRVLPGGDNMIFLTFIAIAELIGLPLIIKYIEYLENKAFQRLYKNMTEKEVIDFFYGRENEDNKK